MGRYGDCRIPKKHETTKDASANRTTASNGVLHAVRHYFAGAGAVFFNFA